MRLFILVALVFTLSNCSEKKPQAKPPIEYYFVKYTHTSPNKINTDTIIYQDMLQRKDESYSLMSEEIVSINGKNYIINKFYGNRFRTEIFRVNYLGTIYVRSLDSSNYKILYTNNDSTNKIVNTLISYFLSEPKFYRPQPEVIDPESRIKQLEWDQNLYNSLNEEK